MISAKKMSRGRAIINAITRGSTKNVYGSNPIVRIADISSVIFMAPISAVYAEPLRPAMTIAVIIGPNSLVIDIATVSTMNISAPNFANCTDPW